MIIKERESLANGEFTLICWKMKTKVDISLKQKPSFSIPPDSITQRPSEFGPCTTRKNVKTVSLQFMFSKLLTKNRNLQITSTAEETTTD